MEKREVKTKDQHSSPCSHTDWIPFELTWKILVRLPETSLMRFRCVSKLWASVISDPEFISSRSCLLLNFQKNDNQLFLRLPQHKNREMCLSNVKYYPLTLSKEDRYAPIFKFQSVHGLISFHYLHHIVIWNPSIGEHVTFRKPNHVHSYIKTYLGYDPIGNTYKVLSMSYVSSEEIHVLTLGAQESWRPIKDIAPWRYFPAKGICIKGVIYIIFYTILIGEILSFDVRTEKFKLIKTHSCIYAALKSTLSLVSYKGRLAWVILESSCYKLWVLEDAEKEEWSCQDFHLPLSPCDPNPKVAYFLSGVTGFGEFIYVSISWQDKEIHVCYYDPKRNNNRRIKMERFEDEDFWLRNGCSDHDWEFIGSMPNHIENLVSLKNFTCLPSV